MTKFSFNSQNTKILQAIVDAIASVVKEGKIKLVKDALTVTSIDPTKTIMVKLDIPHRKNNSFFSAYEIDSDKTLSLDFQDLNTLLKRASSTDLLDVQHDANKNKIRLTFKDEKNRSQRSFDLSLIQDDDEPQRELDVSKLNKTALIESSSELFQLALKDAKAIDADTLEIVSNDTGLFFTAVKEMINDMYNLELLWKDSEGKSDIFSKEIQQETRSLYSISYLEKIFKLSAIIKKVNFSYSSEGPAIFVFETDNGSASIAYVLAPQGEEEDDFEGDSGDLDDDNEDNFEED